MSAILFVFVANSLHNVAVGKQDFRHLYCERLGIQLGIIDGDLHVHMTEIAAMKTLLQAQSFAAGMSAAIQPGPSASAVAITPRARS